MKNKGVNFNFLENRILRDNARHVWPHYRYPEEEQGHDCQAYANQESYVDFCQCFDRKPDVRQSDERNAYFAEFQVWEQTFPFRGLHEKGYDIFRSIVIKLTQSLI
jgi:hypothetical protein